MSKDILEGFKKFRSKAVEIGNKVILAERKFEQDKASIKKDYDHWSYRDYYDFQFSDTNAVSVDLYPLEGDEEEYIELTEQDSDDETKMVDFPVMYLYEDYEKELAEKYEKKLDEVREEQKLRDEIISKHRAKEKKQREEAERKLYLELKEKYEKEDN